MKTAFKTSLTFLFIFSISFSSVSVHAQYHYEFTPSISVSEGYDDNLYLISDNEISDYILAVTPGIEFSFLSEQTVFSLNYAPSFVFYNENTENDTTRHSASVSWEQNFTQHTRFYLTNRFYETEEPLEYDETIQGVRETREPYWRNTVDTGLEFLFGPENRLTLGYGQSYLENDDPTIDDGRIQTPSVSLDYWFGEKDGIELDYQHTKADFWRDVGGEAEDDYTGDGADLRYIHRFSPQTSVFVLYGYLTRDFEVLPENMDLPSKDYDVHEGTIGFDHSFSPQTSLSISGGYFSQDRDWAENEGGPVFDASLTRRFKRGSFTIGGAGGYDESYLDAERRGFTKYSSGTARFEYPLTELLSIYVGGSYRVNKDNTSREWTTNSGNTGITWTFLQHFSLILDYRYAERDDDVDLEDYTSNRIMLSLKAGKLFRH